MCGRYAIAPANAEAWATVGERLGAPVRAMLDDLEPRFNIAPSTQIPIIVREGDQTNVALLARWGFIPHWWKEIKPPKFSTINARSEEAAGKPLWRDAWKHHRCLIAATHWYEWQKVAGGKQPFALQPDAAKAFLFAGLYSHWTPPGSDEAIVTASILTRAAAPSVRSIHDRMPVILAPAGWLAWLGAQQQDNPDVGSLLTKNTIMDAHGYPISTRVNSPRNQGRELLEPATPHQPQNGSRQFDL